MSEIVKRFKTLAPHVNSSWILPGGEASFNTGEVTELTAEQWEILGSDALFLHKVNSGDIQEISSSIPASSLASLSSDSSRAAIAACTDIKALEDYAKNAKSPYLQQLVKIQAQTLMGRLDSLPKLLPVIDLKTISFVSLTPEEAKAAVEAASDKAILVAWQKQSASVPILQGIVNVRLQQLDKSEKEKGEK